MNEMKQKEEENKSLIDEYFTYDRAEVWSSGGTNFAMYYHCNMRSYFGDSLKGYRFNRILINYQRGEMMCLKEWNSTEPAMTIKFRLEVESVTYHPNTLG